MEEGPGRGDTGRRRPVEVIAHRGFSGEAPENTLASIRAAIEAGADRVELDVLLTRDGVPVVIHDADLDRTTDGRGPVGARTLEEIRALSAGRWFHPRFAGERVPTLEEALRECRGRIRVNVEIKEEAVEPEGESPDGVEARVVEAVRKAGLGGETAVSSFAPRALRRVRRLAPELEIQSLYNEAVHRGRGPEEVCAEVGARAFNCSREEATPLRLEECRRDGLKVNVYTVDDQQEMEHLIALGVDGIFTNRPDRLLSVLGRRP